MKKINIKKVLACATTAALAATLAFAATGCSGDSDNNENIPEALTTDTGLTGGVAATVNGVEIPEDDITKRVNNMRLRTGKTEDDEWKEYLESNNETPASVRTQFIDASIERELVVQCADKLGITTNDEEIQTYVDKMRGNYSSDEAWETALDGAGFEDENDYKEALRYSILNKKIEDMYREQQDAGITESELVTEAQNNRLTYDGAKRSSHILFGTSDEELANEVLGQLNNGEVQFAEAVEKYSTDEGSKANGGDVGWDKLTSFVSEYQTALDELEKGQMSKVVKSKFGYHIILVTDVWNAPEEITATNQIPEEILTAIRTKALDSKVETAVDGWVEQMRSEQDVIVNDPPEGLPYWVDVSDKESAEDQAEVDEAAVEELDADVAATEDDVAAVESGADVEADAAAGEDTETGSDTEAE